jgi:hypothetical protein
MHLRRSFPRALVLFGASLFLSTELLGALHRLRRVPLIVWWMVALPAIVGWRRSGRVRFDWVAGLCVGGVTVILTLTAITAAFSPPNSADAMAYHVPRVVYWAEQGSVRYFPTAYFNQIMLQPLAEYLMLQTYVVSGGDHFINLVQWFASLACIFGVSAVAKALGAGIRGQAIAALFCATLPAGILASSGAKNDYFLAMWLVTALWFALQVAHQQPRLGDAVFLGAALGFALLTKATAYLFAPFPIAAILLTSSQTSRKRVAILTLLAIGVALSINTPQYVRNYQLSGSIMGFDSAQGDGVYRWRNENFGWRETVSNVLRNLSDQLGARSTQWNQSVYKVVLAAHQRLGIDVNDPATTWHTSSYGPPLNANHETNAPNRWHLAVLLAAGCVLAARALRGRESLSALYVLGLLCAFLAFCAYLKWQPFFARLLLPLFVLGAPLAGLVMERARMWMQIALCLLLLSNARSAVLENWVRPLKGPRSVLHVSRDTQYFADMTQWNNRQSYLKAVDLLARANCDTVGIDITDYQLEYPLQALLRERNPKVGFVHAGVANASSRYAPSIAAAPCAIVCLDCAGDARRLALYPDFDVRLGIDKFVVLFRRGSGGSNRYASRPLHSARVDSGESEHDIRRER